MSDSCCSKAEPTCAPSCARSNTAAFAPAGDDRGRAGFSASLRVSWLLDLGDQMAVAGRQRVESFADKLIGLRVKLPERQILQLLAAGGAYPCVRRGGA